jgi:OmpA-OmpF porin, OOP family
MQHGFFTLIKELNMNKKLLCAALASGLCVAQAASAQTFDDRWYITGGGGYNFQDNDRSSEDAPFLYLGMGKFLSPNFSLDLELNYLNTHPNERVPFGQDLTYAQYGIGLDARYHFARGDRNWWPYLVGGIGYQRAEEEYDNFPNPDSPGRRKDSFMAAKAGFGLQADVGRVGVRTELAYRVSFDDGAVSPNRDGSFEVGGVDDSFADLMASVGVVIPLGPAPVAPIGPAPVAPSCADLDDDGDGVNNCDDRCPGTAPGTAVGPDGCPVPLTIDLRGVNFDFDKSTLRPDAIAILNEAVQILQRYPELRVEVAGHTDKCGTDAYNQGLSERRARAVYDYLTSNGVDSSRLAGPNGYGESRPLEMTPDTHPACRSETNRRTELNVQN